MTIISNQVNIELHKIRQRCPLFESSGLIVSTTVALFIGEMLWCAICDTVVDVVHSVRKLLLKVNKPKTGDIICQRS